MGHNMSQPNWVPAATVYRPNPEGNSAQQLQVYGGPPSSNGAAVIAAAPAYRPDQPNPLGALLTIIIALGVIWLIYSFILKPLFFGGGGAKKKQGYIARESLTSDDGIQIEGCDFAASPPRRRVAPEWSWKSSDPYFC